MSELILMLTRADRTVTDARELHARLAHADLRHVGFKDIGLPESELSALVDDIRAQGSAVHIEVVAETPQATIASAQMAVKLGPDYLLGGTLIEPVRRIIAGSDIKFFPYVGQVTGHPCLLRGTIEEIAQDARRAQDAGVDGINLLAYRYDGDVPALIEAVVNATTLPVICAGSIASPDQIALVSSMGAWAFTVGTAILDCQVAPNAPLDSQVAAALAAA